MADEFLPLLEFLGFLALRIVESAQLLEILHDGVVALADLPEQCHLCLARAIDGLGQSGLVQHVIRCLADDVQFDREDTLSIIVPVEDSGLDPEAVTRDEVYEMAKDLNIDGRSDMNKAELVEAVEVHR